MCIAVSGGGLPGDRQRSSSAGIAVHLLKPADPAALVALLAGVFRARPPATLAIDRAPAGSGHGKGGREDNGREALTREG